MTGIILCDGEEQCGLPVDEMAENAAYIAYHTFKWQFATLILVKAAFLNVISDFVKVYGKKVKLHKLSETMKENNFVDDIEQYVLFLNDTSDIALTLETMKLQKFNPNSKFLIVCYSNYCFEKEAIQILWNYRIVNVVYMKNEDNVINTYTYFPSADCDHPKPQTIHLEDCIHSYKQKASTARRIFPLKLMNFHRCPLFVTTFELYPYMLIKDGEPSGTDGDLLTITINALNATLVLMTPQDKMGWGVHVNNSWNGVLGDIQNNLANLSLTSSFMNLKRYQDFDMSMSYNTLNLVWLIPPLELESSSLKLLKPFTNGAWFFIMTTFIIFTLSHYFFDHKVWRILSKRFILDKFSHDFFVYTFQITLGVSVTKYPVNFCKNLIVYWIWYWFLVRTLYQVNLIYFLQTDVKINNVNTIQDAIDLNYRFGSSSAIEFYYKDNKIMSKNWLSVNVSDITSTLRTLTKGRKVVFGTNLIIAKVLQRSTHVKLHTLPKKILESYCVTYFSKNSSVTRPINLIFTRLFEAGIVDKIFKDYTSVLPEAQDSPYMPLTLNHFTGCFVLLILGWVLSSVVFILEHLFRIRNKKHKL